ncbi:flagellar motor protein MotB [Quadrisphaera sp. DSM 44207]|uniref:OmpA/MotB family protein n=1 Tax=Quadrisphaera sp. DSM 44207 TaxID=1881057 RepID=UPI00088E105D|nr:flagellar motor protein MotB [Quadrisphaera sp. DSM 44207]SDQ19901.1 chemotaxis protein MotB [Quadrisphaera sp. DSM 44207]
MSGGKGSKGRARRGGHEEEHENHERWAVSYGDMMTVLMALFLVLFAMSNVDQAKYEALKASLAVGFGNAALPVAGGDSVIEASSGEPNPVEIVRSASGIEVGAAPEQASGAGSGAPESAEIAARAEASRLVEIREQLEEALAAQSLSDRASLTITERGLVVTVVADEIFFADASAAIQPTGLRVVDAVAPVLAGLPEDVAVEGHANHLALTPSAAYPTNWELSAARATAVLRRLESPGGVVGERLEAVGLGQTHPLYDPADPRAIEGNRRVDVVVLSDQPADVRALVPAFAGEALGGTHG